jgi:hypothetical protein
VHAVPYFPKDVAVKIGQSEGEDNDGITTDEEYLLHILR